MPAMNLDLSDAVELAELLQFLHDWLSSGHDHLHTALESFVGNTHYDLQQLRADLDRFTFLLGGNDGKQFFQSG
jgi:hypothetical protein